MSPSLASLASLGLLACTPAAVAPTTPARAPTARPPVAVPAPAASVASGYDQPPQNVLDVLHAPSPPSPYVSPTRDRILLTSWIDYPAMSRVAEPFLKLAGVRVEPKTRRKHDTPGGYGINPCARSFVVATIEGGAQVTIPLPAGCVDSPSWAADGKRFTFRNTTADSVELWLGDAVTGKVHAFAGVRLNPMLGSSTAQWMPDQKTLLVKLVPANAGPPPAAPVVPLGPSIQEANGEKGESSTYETRDTLTSKRDEDLFDYYATSQLALIDVASGAVTPVGKPGVYYELDVSPDSQNVLVGTIHKPYSYVTTFDRFPRDVAVWDRTGKVVHAVASLPLFDRVPVHGVPTGPRDFDWRPTEPATLVWAEALDGGDWNQKVPARDKVMLQKAPFTTPPRELVKTEQRFAGLWWGQQGLAFLGERDENRHWRKTFTLNADDPQPAPKVLWDLSTDERYKDPGELVQRALPNGQWVVHQDGDAVFLAGQGSSPDGDRPFLDRLDLKTQKTERLFRSEKNAYENFLALTQDQGRALLTWHQSPTDPPNAFVRTSSASRAVTHFADPTPAVRAIKKRLVQYKRKDGTSLSFTLYTPPGYVEGTKVPTILYAYPLDYAEASKAGQVTGSEYTFTRLRQYKLLLLAGYAIVDNAAFPIVGDPKKAYDTYLEQLVADAKAAVDKAVDIGVADPDRIGITGHSHGALMTVNLLAHSDLFRAGVATSGSYNKTLTPFGFQNERRSVWDAQSVYLKVSPFFFADKLKLPVLLVHGLDDANPGTTPLQATKLYEAIRGNGGTTRLVMLPHEPHSYSAMESNEQLAAEMIRWFDKYVKNAPPRTKAK